MVTIRNQTRSVYCFEILEERVYSAPTDEHPSRTVGRAQRVGVLKIGSKNDTDEGLIEGLHAAESKAGGASARTRAEIAAEWVRDLDITPYPVAELAPEEWEELGTHNRAVIRDLSSQGLLSLEGDPGEPAEAAA